MPLDNSLCSPGIPSQQADAPVAITTAEDVITTLNSEADPPRQTTLKGRQERSTVSSWHS
jgi:hypothetical protein